MSTSSIAVPQQDDDDGKDTNYDGRNAMPPLIATMHFKEWTARHRSRHDLVADDHADDAVVHHMTIPSFTTTRASACGRNATYRTISSLRHSLPQQQFPAPKQIHQHTSTSTITTPTHRVTPPSSPPPTANPTTTTRNRERPTVASTTLWKSLEMAAMRVQVRGGPRGHMW